MTLTTIFDHADPGHLALPVWRNFEPDGKWLKQARWYARTFGEAKVWKADGSVVRFWREDGKIRQRTYRNIIHTNQ